ncbi:DUF1080 domain-containing protein [bacterium]|nr:DUF1080 domain-containing protein [bacterium]
MKITQWGIVSLVCCAAFPLFAAEPQALFNGKDLSGWEGKLDYWSVKEDAIVGTSPGLKENYFLATKEEYGDFELRFEIKLHDSGANSGVQFRSQRIPGSTEMIGYQADIGQGYWGALYDESRRRKILAAPDPELIKKTLKPGDWNEYVVRAVGKHITLSINGVNTVDYLEPDDEIARTGHIALQVHSGGPFQVEFRKLTLKPLTAE